MSTKFIKSTPYIFLLRTDLCAVKENYLSQFRQLFSPMEDDAATFKAQRHKWM